ncbi:MAG: T9SS type A sorting domain-containing protein [Chitinophagaceae bacterium]
MKEKSVCPNCVEICQANIPFPCGPFDPICDYEIRVPCVHCILKCVGIRKKYEECLLQYMGGECTSSLQNSLLQNTPNSCGRCYTHETETRGPVDPNEKLVNAKKYIQPLQTLVYPIHYENIGNVEVQDVFVWDTLDNNLDTSTLQIITPGATYNAASRSIKWNLLNKNLQPGATDNVLLSIKPKQNLPSGTVIRNKASIQFKIFEKVQTNEVENIIDAIKPKSSMLPLPAKSPDLNIKISWLGTDSIGIIESYSIFVATDTGGYQPLLLNTTYTSAMFVAEPGKLYKFICIAKDQAGNVEVKEPIAEAAIATDLPVELISFSGALKGKDVLLQWETANEQNSRHFVVQRSIDGVNFENLGQVNAAGNSNRVKGYSYTDRNAAALGLIKIYYRLQEVDLDGTFTFSKVINVNVDRHVETFTIVPNPASDNILVQLNGVSANNIASLDILDFTGRKIISRGISLRAGSNTIPVSISSLSNGYLCTHSGITGQEMAKKV